MLYTDNYFHCSSCVSCQGTCQCEKSVYHGVDLDNLPWGVTNISHVASGR